MRIAARCTGHWTGRIEELETPVCKAGQACPQFIILRGVIGHFAFTVTPCPRPAPASGPSFAGLQSAFACTPGPQRPGETTPFTLTWKPASRPADAERADRLRGLRWRARRAARTSQRRRGHRARRDELPHARPRLPRHLLLRRARPGRRRQRSTPTRSRFAASTPASDDAAATPGCDVDVGPGDAEALAQVLAERARAERLGRMMAGRDEVDARLARASARAHSAGSPVMNASSPRAIASWTLRAPPPETIPTVRTRCGPAGNTSGSRAVSVATRATSSAASIPSPGALARDADRAPAVTRRTAAGRRARGPPRSARCCPRRGCASSGRW